MKIIKVFFLLIVVTCLGACTQNINLDTIQCQPLGAGSIFATRVNDNTLLQDSLTGATFIFTTVDKKKFHRSSYNAKQSCNCKDSIVTVLASSVEDTILFYTVKKYLPNQILSDIFACSVKWHTESEFHTSTNYASLNFINQFGQTTRTNNWKIANSVITDVAYARGTDIQFADLVNVKGINLNLKISNFKNNFDQDTTVFDLQGCE
jgi:hypothetical protein